MDTLYILQKHSDLAMTQRVATGTNLIRSENIVSDRLSSESLKLQYIKLVECVATVELLHIHSMCVCFKSSALHQERETHYEDHKRTVLNIDWVLMFV